MLPTEGTSLCAKSNKYPRTLRKFQTRDYSVANLLHLHSDVIGRSLSLD